MCIIDGRILPTKQAPPEVVATVATIAGSLLLVEERSFRQIEITKVLSLASGDSLVCSRKDLMSRAAFRVRPKLFGDCVDTEIGNRG